MDDHRSYPHAQFLGQSVLADGDVKETFEVNAMNPKAPGIRYSDSQKKDDVIQFPLNVGRKYNVKWDYPNFVPQ